MKQFLKNATLVIGGIALAMGSMVFAATWQGTTTIENGQIIDASIISENFDYLYERSWDFLGDVSNPTHIHSDISVAAPEYCDENGENCMVPGESSSIIPGWPDVLVCSSSGSAIGSAWTGVMWADYMPHRNGDRYTYRTPASGDVYIGAYFNSDGSWHSGSDTDCTGKSIAQLYAEGKAFDLNPTSQVDDYIWSTGTWGECTANNPDPIRSLADLGGFDLSESTPTQTRSVQCIDTSTGDVVNDSNCTAPMPDTEQTCTVSSSSPSSGGDDGDWTGVNDTSLNSGPHGGDGFGPEDI